MARGFETCPNRGLCSTSSHGLLWRAYAFWDHRAESECRFRLGTWTKEIRTVLLAGVLEQVDAAVCQEKHVHPKASASCRGRPTKAPIKKIMSSTKNTSSKVEKD